MNKTYTVSFTTLGCKVNQFETEAMAELLEQDGFEIVPHGEKSDIFIINTCAVTKESDRKSRQLINKAKRINPNAIVVAVGCSVQLHSETISKETNVDIIIGTKNKNNISKLLKEKLMCIEKDINTDNNTNNGTNNDAANITANEIIKFKGKEDYEELKISTVHDRTRANIKIQDGCSQFCSYCIIPYVRGPIRSRDKDDIIEEVVKLAKNNYKEVVLNGIHISSYGVEKKQSNALIDLIESIAKIDGIERIRLGSLEPNIVTDDFARRIAALNKVCDHFHLSLQSGNNAVLSRMNRKYTKEQYAENVRILRKYMPNSGITTDIIVGFPGETDEEFEDTFEFVKTIKFSRIHVFKYSVREGTKAADMDCQVKDEIKSFRSKKLIELGESLAMEFMHQFEDKDMSVLFEVEKSEDGADVFEGYTSNYLKVIKQSDANITNEIETVHITGIKGDMLIAE